MDEPGWAWPAWKFGMKREDLNTKLHDQYNTITSTLQDPEAFHHDVFEVAHEASSPEEFHRLMGRRKEQRIKELQDSLQSAAFEIIAHPKLVGTEQWQYALQLFRTQSLDSLVRYFASYLPENYLRRRGYQTPSSAASSFAETTTSCGTASTDPSSVGESHASGVILADHKGEAVFTDEPEAIHDTISASIHLPPSPRSMTMKSDSSAPSPCDIDTHDFAMHPLTPARTMSFSGSESEAVPRPLPFSQHLDDEETSQSEGGSPAASDEDLAESRSSLGSIGPFSVSELDRNHPPPVKMECLDADDDFETCQPPPDDDCPAQLPMDSVEPVETPTPKQETTGSSYMDSKTLSAYRAQSYRASSPKLHRRDGSPGQGLRRSPEELFSRIQKPMPDPTRNRPKGRRRLD